MDAQRSLCMKVRSPQETVVDGLLRKTPLPKISIREVKGKGRGVFIEEDINMMSHA